WRGIAAYGRARRPRKGANGEFEPVAAACRGIASSDAGTAKTCRTAKGGAPCRVVRFAAVAAPPARSLGPSLGISLAAGTSVTRHHLPVFSIDSQGSLGGKASPFCSNSIE